MKKSRSLKWIFTMWLLVALVPALGTFVGMFIFLFRNVVLENIENILKNNSIKSDIDGELLDQEISISLLLKGTSKN